MTQTVKLSAFLIANQLDIKGIKSFLDIKPLADSSSELYYNFSGGKYQYYFNYGVVVFAGYNEDEMKWAIKTVSSFQRNPSLNWMRDDHDLIVEERTGIAFDFDRIVLDRLDDQVIRIAMFNLAQSVALDYYHGVSETLLTEVKSFARQLELTGKLKISRNNMMRFIGKALNTQNDIAENIYIFDAPDQVWDDEYLDKLHQGLMKYFDLRIRFSEVEYTLRIIEDNLSVFREIIHQRESSLLEYIIILLILVEVFDLLISKILKLTA
jgi:required for meiotic nuclear division protein 1